MVTLSFLRGLPFGFFILLITLCTNSFAQQSYYIDTRLDGSAYELDAIGKSGFQRWSRTENFMFKLSDLPTTGRMNRIPWSDSNWPQYRGGINWRWYNPLNLDNNRYEYEYAKDQPGDPYDWDYAVIRPPISYENVKDMNQDQIRNLSPAEKFDVYRAVYNGDQSLSSKIAYEFDWQLIKQPWAGFCGGWSAASLHFEQPSPVTVTNEDGITIPFGSSDIKALLTYYFDGGFFVKDLAGVEHINGEVDFDEGSQLFKKIVVSVGEDCKPHENNKNCGDDLTPGQFHILLGNLVGVHSKGFIVDVQSGSNRYYQPPWFYRSTFTAIHNNPNLMRVTTEIRTSVDLTEKPGIIIDTTNPDHFEYTEPSFEKLEPQNFRTQSLTYEYIIEINAEGEILIDSTQQEWISEIQPDSAFMWQKPMDFGGVFSELTPLYDTSTE